MDAGLRFAENVVRSHAQPDDVELPFYLFFAVLKRRSTVICPCHLIDTFGAFDSLDPQSLAKGPVTPEVFDEFVDGRPETRLFLAR